MTGAHGLHGLAFAAIRRSPQRPLLRSADRVAGIPELGGDAAVTRILEHACFLAALDLPADFGPKLEIVPAIVDRPAPVRLHVDAVVGRGDQVRELSLSGQEADVGHADERNAIPGLGAHGPVRARLVDGRGGLTRRKIAGEEAVSDDGSGLRGDPFIVVGKSAETGAVGHGGVRDHIDKG